VLLAVLVVATVWVAPVFTNDKTEKPAMKLNKLTPEEERVIVNKGTEPAFTGEFYKHHADGTYTCRRCGALLFKSDAKFDSGCGWPSFDDAIPGAVTEQVDADGHRTEIVCARCGGHLGHVFRGEGFTDKNTRHCVNSISLSFVSADEPTAVPIQATADAPAATEKAYFAGGCFWGTEYFLQQAEGVISAQVGYMGGQADSPDYHEVCTGATGHAEAVEVVFDPTRTDFETLARLFFEIHDPTQVDRQGPDKGNQYRSEVFYVDDAQKATTRKLIGLLEANGYRVATTLEKAGRFWPAEDYHQDYYEKNGHQPYCHGYVKRF
jgi:peptide methionine sulfoxide reductase msrA/msrB